MDKLKDNVVQIQQKVDEINTAVEVRANTHTRIDRLVVTFAYEAPLLALC